MATPEMQEESKRRGLRKVKSLNLRTPEQLEEVAQGMDDLLDLIELKKILIGGEVFADEGVTLSENEKGQLLKNKAALNQQARKSNMITPDMLSEEEVKAEMSSQDLKAKLTKNSKKLNDVTKPNAKKSSFRERPTKAKTGLVKGKKEPVKKEEWENINISVKEEFWRDNEIKSGEYFHGFAIKGWRESMEDTMDSKSSIKPEIPNLFGVYDGHGGDGCAKYCERMLLQQIAKSPELSTNTKNVLESSFINLDTDFNRGTSTTTSGTTATVIYVAPINVAKKEKNARKVGKMGASGVDNPRYRKKKSGKTAKDRIAASIKHTASMQENTMEFKYFCAAAGDSRAALVYSSGKVVPLSEDHNLKKKDELERVKSGDGEIRYDPEFNELLVYSKEAQRGLNVTRTIGDKDFKPFVTPLPDVKEGYLTRDAAYFLIASDGLWAQVQTKEIGRIMVEYGLEQGLKNLADLSNARGCFDNCTVLGVAIQPMLGKMDQHFK